MFLKTSGSILPKSPKTPAAPKVKQIPMCKIEMLVPIAYSDTDYEQLVMHHNKKNLNNLIDKVYAYLNTLSKEEGLSGAKAYTMFSYKHQKRECMVSFYVPAEIVVHSKCLYVPKGVHIEHKAIENITLAGTDVFELTGAMANLYPQGTVKLGEHHTFKNPAFEPPKLVDNATPKGMLLK